VTFLFALSTPWGVALKAQVTPTITQSQDSVSLRFVDTDIRAIVQALGQYLPKPVLMGEVPPSRVSLQTPRPVPLRSVVSLLRGLVVAQGLQFEEDSAYFHVRASPTVESPSDLVGQGNLSTAFLQLFVYRLKHARSVDVASTLNLLYGNGPEFAGSGGIVGGTLSEELRRQNVPPEVLGRPPQVAVEPSPTAPPATLGGSVTVVPDERTNSLLIRASESDFAVLRVAIGELDIRPLQVLIEVLIVEARRDRGFSLNANLFMPPRPIGDGGTVEGTVTGGGVGDLVIRLMNIGKGDIDAVIGASERKGDVQIISRPVLLASNNTEARFLVGSQRPFVQVSRSLPTESANRDQVIQYRDVGTKLTVRPTINQDGYVSLVIQQEINAATSEVAFDAPVISTREASTQVLVRDGQTIVLGGMQDHQREKSSSGVPFFSGIPFIGGLFGATTQSASSTEVYIFLTPRILRTDEDADQVTAPRLSTEAAP
jgi:general secretion pathway protein D